MASCHDCKTLLTPVATGPGFSRWAHGGVQHLHMALLCCCSTAIWELSNNCPLGLIQRSVILVFFPEKNKAGGTASAFLMQKIGIQV